MDENIYNKHYIRLDGHSNIIDGWSDALFPEKARDGDVCINEQGGYQFRLFDGGEENPLLRSEDGVYLYRYENGAAAAQTQAEIINRRIYGG